MGKQHTTAETNIKAHGTIPDQWNAALCGAELQILESKKDAKKGEVNMWLGTCGSFPEGTGAWRQSLRMCLV